MAEVIKASENFASHYSETRHVRGTLATQVSTSGVRP